MHEDGPAKGMKSTATAKPLRSRGFLSQPGGQAAGSGDDTGKPNKSRGQRQPVASRDGKPSGLATKAQIKPYSPEDT